MNDMETNDRNKRMRVTTKGKPEIVNSLVGQGPVVVLPRELLLDEALRLERLHRSDTERAHRHTYAHGHDDLDVAGALDLAVLGLVPVLVGNKDTVSKEGLVDSLAGLGRDDHPACTALRSPRRQHPTKCAKQGAITRKDWQSKKRV
jgi:hypothetical protein